MMPSMVPSTSTCQTLTRPDMVKAMRRNAWSIAKDCVAITVRWRFQRSVSTPASGRSIAAGINAVKSATPSRSEDLLRR